MKNANPVCAFGRRSVLALLALLVLGACQKPATDGSPKTVADHFDIKVGDRTVHMQIAATTPEMERGLMERTNLGADEGMLFVYDRPQRMSFWMRNTPTPLDIGFFDKSGRLQEIYPLQPFDETTVESRGTQLALALEMNQGWYQTNGVRPGAQLDLAAVREALKARGFDPTRFAAGR